MVSIDKELFISYINTNEVVYQMADELVEVLHSDETKQKKDLISNVDASSCISIGTDMGKLIEMGFDELVNWSNSNDYLICVDDYLLLCIPKSDIALLTHDNV
jgi:hypothetical protein